MNTRRIFRQRAGGLLPLMVTWIGVAAVLLLGAPTAHAQEKLVERTGSAEAPIYQDNVDAARSRAVRSAQHNAVLQLLQELVAAEWLTLFRTELKRSVLYRTQKYITSYRIDRLAPSLDRTRYQASLTALVNRSRLVRDVHALSLPVIGDPMKRLGVFYRSDDPVLGKATPREEVLEALRRRMALLSFKVESGTPLNEKDQQLFASVPGDEAARGAWLSRRGLAAGLFITFNLIRVPGMGDEQPQTSEATAQIFQARNGKSLGLFSAKTGKKLGQPGRSARDRKTLMSSLVRPLMAQLQPGGVKEFGEDSGKSEPLEVRLLGISKVEDEEAFARAFFSPDTPFARFYVSRLDGKTMSYRGPFRGDRKALETDLPGKTYGDFRIRNVFWFNDLLELEVVRDKQPAYREARLFPASERRANINDLLATVLTDNPELLLSDPEFTEVEDNGWLNRSNRAPFNTTIYGFIDSRRDSDFYVAEELKEGEVLNISWYRVGRTSLDPALRIYDGRGQPIRFYYPRNWVRTKYRVPKGQHKVFIEVSDRFSGIRWDSGGYLSYHYLVLVERAGTD